MCVEGGLWCVMERTDNRPVPPLVCCTAPFLICSPWSYKLLISLNVLPPNTAARKASPSDVATSWRGLHHKSCPTTRSYQHDHDTPLCRTSNEESDVFTIIRRSLAGCTREHRRSFGHITCVFFNSENLPQWSQGT